MRARLFAACALCFFAAACGSGTNSIDVTSPSAVKCEVSATNALIGAVPYNGVTSTVTVTTTRDCTWSASSNASWLTLSSTASGQGSGSIEYRVAPNGDPSQRRAVLEVNNTQLPVVQDPAPCRYTVSPTSTAVSAAGGTLTISVGTLTGCAWTAAPDASWITVTANGSGNRAGTVAVAVAPNTGPLRRGTVNIGGEGVSIEQSAFVPGEPTPCTVEIAPTTQNVTADAGTGTITVTAAAGCAWTASSNTPWITIASGASGSGNGTVAFAVTANGGGVRNGSIAVGGKTATITQSAVPCTYSIGSNSQTVPAEGGTGSVSVSAGNGCGWTASSPVSWITITSGGSGSGNGNVQFSVAANSGTIARSATLTVAGRAFTVTQAAPPPPCTISINPTSQSVGEPGGPVSIAVTASGTTCGWTTTPHVPWITIVNGASGTGNGTVNLSVAANTGSARTGTVTIGGQTLTINQGAAPPPCTFTIAPASQAVPSTGGPATVTITASAPTCAWTAAPNVPWITFSSATSGTGNGSVSMNVAANAGPARSGTATIAGQTFTVNQSAPPPPPPACTYAVAPATQAVPAAGGSGSVTVTASDPSCAWSVANGAPAWISITSPASGSGNGSVTFNAAANGTGAARSGTLTIAGQTATITQSP
jgi:hypothetical protein